jgi:hypothetical protein
MRKLVKNTIVISVISLLTAGQVRASVNDVFINICEIIEVDASDLFRKRMNSADKNFNLKLKSYYKSMSCEGNNLVRTAILSNSFESGVLMVKKLPKNIFTTPEHDGKTDLEWALESGLDNTPIVDMIKLRIN